MQSAVLMIDAKYSLKTMDARLNRGTKGKKAVGNSPVIRQDAWDSRLSLKRVLEVLGSIGMQLLLAESCEC